jgi:3-hydroxyisobutyrate dehydrogenase
MLGWTDAGIIANARAGALLIDSSTIAPQCSQQVAAAAEAAQMTMVDAPVSVRPQPLPAE